jgi:hypothetical protein
MRLVCSYSMKGEPDRDRTVAPQHAAYWDDLEVPNYLGGPYAGQSGGLITVSVPEARPGRP